MILDKISGLKVPPKVPCLKKIILLCNNIISMKKIIVAFFIMKIIFSGNMVIANNLYELDTLSPVFDSRPVFEEIVLESEIQHKYKFETKKIEKYVKEQEKPRGPLLKKGRYSTDANIANKTDKFNGTTGDKLIFQHNLSVTDEFSFLMVDKVNPRSLDFSQELGVKYSPKKFKGTDFSVLGSDKDGKQKLKFNTDLYLW